MNIKNVGVVGCGQMGGGIVEVSARAGYHVVVLEVNQAFLDKGVGCPQEAEKPEEEAEGGFLLFFRHLLI